MPVAAIRPAIFGSKRPLTGTRTSRIVATILPQSIRELLHSINILVHDVAAAGLDICRAPVAGPC
jgi:hypothetical protein